MLLLFFIWRWNFLLFVFQVEYFSRNSNRPTKQQFPMVLRLVYILSTYCTDRRCFYFFSFDRRCLLFVGCFFSFRGHVQLPKLSIRNKFVMKMLFCTIIVVIMSNHIRRITLNLLCTVTCCAVQQIFFFFLPPKLSIRNKFVIKMVFCTIIVVIMSNPIRRITLNLLCTVTCCVVQQI